MWCLVDRTAGNAEVTSLNVLLGSWGVVPEVLEISHLGHDVAEHLVEPCRRSSRTAACVHTRPLRHRTHRTRTCSGTGWQWGPTNSSGAQQFHRKFQWLHQRRLMCLPRSTPALWRRLHAPGIRNGSHSPQSYRATELESWILPNWLHPILVSVKLSVTNFCRLNFEKQIVCITFGDGAGCAACTPLRRPWALPPVRQISPPTRLSLHSPSSTCVPTNCPEVFLLLVHQHQQPPLQTGHSPVVWICNHFFSSN